MSSDAGLSAECKQDDVPPAPAIALQTKPDLTGRPVQIPRQHRLKAEPDARGAAGQDPLPAAGVGDGLTQIAVQS